MYPYDFKPKTDGINHREVFVAMPFEDKYDSLFNDLIEPAVSEANTLLGIKKSKLSLKPFRTKDDIRTTSGWMNVLEHLTTAQIVIGVLTDNNPNVFYELGIAHATQPITRQILIAENGYERSFDTKDLIYYEYNMDDLEKSVNELAIRIADSIKTYNIEEDKKILRARMCVGPVDFEVIITYGKMSHFNINSSEDKTFDRHSGGIKNLCINRLLGFNTMSEVEDGKFKKIEFSYYWTSLGNDVLNLMGFINKKELLKRRSELPEFFER